MSRFPGRSPKTVLILLFALAAPLATAAVPVLAEASADPGPGDGTADPAAPKTSGSLAEELPREELPREERAGEEKPDGAADAAAAPSPPPATSPPPTLELEEALARAQAESPALGLAEARLEAARAEVLRASTWPHDPEIEVEAAERSGPDGSSTDRGVTLGQEIELFGQRGKRVRAAEAALAAAEATHRRALQEIRNRVETAFARALAEERRVEIARAEQGLVEELLAFEERRLEAGAGTQIDLNLARAAAGQVLQDVQEALAARAAARAALAEAVGADPARPPAPAPGPASPAPAPAARLPAREALVSRALELRADLGALGRAVEAAEARLALERSLAYPNLRAAVFHRREEGDEITGGAVGIAVPLFDRNQGGIARARADLEAARAELAAGALAVRRSVAEAEARYRTAAESVAALDALVVGTLEESLDLLQRAFEAGKVSAVDVLLLRRELVEAQRRHVEAQLALAAAGADLRLAVGDPDLPHGVEAAPGSVGRSLVPEEGR